MTIQQEYIVDAEFTELPRLKEMEELLSAEDISAAQDARRELFRRDKSLSALRKPWGVRNALRRFKIAGDVIRAANEAREAALVKAGQDAEDATDNAVSGAAEGVSDLARFDAAGKSIILGKVRAVAIRAAIQDSFLDELEATAIAVHGPEIKKGLLKDGVRLVGEGSITQAMIAPLQFAKTVPALPKLAAAQQATLR
jgi:hypothetical protein